MNYLVSFIIENFVMICACIVVLINSIQNFHQHLKVSTYSILIVILLFILSISTTMEYVGRDLLNTNLTLLFSIFGYILRPTILYVFILMSWNNKNLWKIILTAIPLLVITIIFFLAFIPSMGKLIVNYFIGDDGAVYFGGGPLRYSSHILGACYLAWLIYLCIYKLKTKHLNHAFAILFCALFVVFAVLIETFFNNNGDVHILNATIAVSTLSYYLFLYMEKTQFDSLTHLYNRESFYRDSARFGKSVTGIIQFDLNGLKYINDNYGHFEGDKALSTVAKFIVKSAKRNMYVYRLGGDEFIILAVNCTEQNLIDTLNVFKQEMSKSNYYCSIGYAYKKKGDSSLEDLMKEAEGYMYQDKAEFYKDSPFERRKS